MLVQQLRCAEVSDASLLAVMDSVPRELFVPAAYRGLAFADTEIPIGHDQRMLTPTLAGRLLQAMTLNPQDRVLEIGTGSGYLTACLARLADQVTSIELFDDMSAAARRRLDQLRLVNTELRVGDAFASQPGEFDAIAVTGSVSQWTPRFEAWLRPGGRLFMVVGQPPLMEAWLVLRRDANQWHRRRLFETVLPPLVNGPNSEPFQF